MKVSFTSGKSLLRDWLTRHWLALFSIALGLLCLRYLFPSATSPTVSAGSVRPMSKKAVRRAHQAQAARLDSIKQETLKLPAHRQTRDSALIAARAHNSRATYYLHLLSNEATPVAPAAEHVARTLANYQPGNYPLDSTHSLQ